MSEVTSSNIRRVYSLRCEKTLFDELLNVRDVWIGLRLLELSFH